MAYVFQLARVHEWVLRGQLIESHYVDSALFPIAYLIDVDSLH